MNELNNTYLDGASEVEANEAALREDNHRQEMEDFNNRLGQAIGRINRKNTTKTPVYYYGR